MAAFQVKGVRVGEGRPLTVVSIMGATEDVLVEQAQAVVQAGSDCVEWRADFARDLTDPDAMVRTSLALADALPRTPLLFTLRSKEQGGQVPLDAERYATLVRTILAHGQVDLVDLELGLGDDLVRTLANEAQMRNVRVVVSHHDFTGTPANAQMASVLEHEAALGADIIKLAVFAHNSSDCLRLMETTARMREELEPVLLTIAMGKAGALSRVAGESCGSALTFCALGTPSAPGQIALHDALRVLDDLHTML